MPASNYQELKQEWIRILLSHFNRHELLDLEVVALIYGYQDVRNVRKKIEYIPKYQMGENQGKCKYAVKDIAADLARRASYPSNSFPVTLPKSKV